MTNRELLSKAMPLTSLSRTEWNIFNSFIENTEPDTELHKILTTLCSNQAKLEVISNYLFYFDENEFRENSIVL